MLALPKPKKLKLVHSTLLGVIYGAQMHILKPILQVYGN